MFIHSWSFYIYVVRLKWNIQMQNTLKKVCRHFYEKPNSFTTISLASCACFQHEIVWLSFIIKLQSAEPLFTPVRDDMQICLISGRQDHLWGFKFKYCLLWQEDEPANDSNLSVVILVSWQEYEPPQLLSPPIISSPAPAHRGSRDDSGPRASSSVFSNGPSLVLPATDWGY